MGYNTKVNLGSSGGGISLCRRGVPAWNSSHRIMQCPEKGGGKLQSWQYNTLMQCSLSGRHAHCLPYMSTEDRQSLTHHCQIVLPWMEWHSWHLQWHELSLLHPCQNLTTLMQNINQNFLFLWIVYKPYEKMQANRIWWEFRVSNVTDALILPLTFMYCCYFCFLHQK